MALSWIQTMEYAKDVQKDVNNVLVWQLVQFLIVELLLYQVKLYIVD
jgi:hypothetical protein